MAASLIGLAFLFFAAASHLLLVLASQEQSRKDLATWTSRELTRVLGVQVEVEGVEPGLFQVIVLRHLTLSSAKDRLPFFSAPRVELGYNLWRLLARPRHPEAALTYISVWDPEVNLSAQEVERLSARFSNQAGGRDGLRIWINLLRGRASYSGEDGKSTRLEGIRGRIQADGRLWRVSWLEGRWREAKSTWFLEGKVITGQRPLFDLRLRLPSLNLSACEHLPFPHQWLKRWSELAPRGVAALDLKVKGSYKQPLVTGSVDLKGVALSLRQGIHLEDVSGQLEVAGEKIAAQDLRFRWAEGLGRLSGEMTGWEHPHLAVRLQVSGVSLRSKAVRDLFLRQEWPETWQVGWRKTDGRLALYGSATGPVDDLVFSGSLSWQGRELLGLPWREAEVAIEYVRGVWTVRRLTAHGPAGEVAGEGVVSGGGTSRAFAGALRLQKVDLAKLSRSLRDLGLAGVPLSAGILEGRLAWSGRGWEKEQVRAVGTLAIREPSFQNWKGDRLEAGFVLTGGTWYFNEIKVLRGEALAVASGEVSPEGKLALLADLRQVDLAELWPLLPREWREKAGEVKGHLNFHGRVQGSLADPAVSGWFEVTEAAWHGQSFEQAEGYLQWQKPQLKLERVAILHGSSTYRMEGELLFAAPDPVARLNGEVEGGEIADLLRLAGVSWDLKGEAHGQISLSGPLSAPALEGKVSITKGRVAGQEFQRAEIQFEGRGREIALDSFIVESPLGRGYGSGTIQGERLAIDLRVERIQLAAFPRLTASLGRVAGTLEFTGRLAGTLKDPLLTGEVKAQNLVLGPYLLDRATGPVEYRAGRLYSPGLRLQRGQEEYTLNGKLALQPDPPFEIKVDFKRARLSELLKLADQQLPVGMEALCDGTAWVTGRASRPRVRVNLLATEGYRGEGDLTAALILEMEGEHISLERFSVLQKGGGDLSVRGTWSAGGAVDFSVTAESFALEPVLKIWYPALPLEGKLSGRVKVTGSAASPRLEGSFALEGGRVGEVPFQRAEGIVRLVEGAVELEGVQVAAGGQLLQVEGRVPLPPSLAERLGGTARATAPVDLTASLPWGNLRILNLALGHQVIREGRGTLNLRLIGPRDGVEAYGTFQFEQLSLSAPPFTVEEGEGHLLFRGQQVVIGRTSARVNGGAATGRGTLTLKGLAVQEMDLHFQAEDLHYSDSFLDGLIDADLFLQGSADLPLLKGRMQLARATLNLGHQLGKGSSPLNAALDIELTNSDDVRVVGGESVDVRTYGRLKIGGTLREPTLAGRAEATRGVIVYLGTIFRVSEGSAVFTSLHGVNPQLDVSAQARAEDALINLHISGQVPELNLQLSSDPPLSEEEILERLALTGKISRLVRSAGEGEVTGEEMLSLLDEEIRSTVFRGLEHAVRDVLQLDEFRLERGFAEEQVQMQFGKYLVDDLYVTYSRSLNLEQPAESLRFEYRFRPGVIFTSGFDSRGEIWLGLEGKLRF